MLHEPHSSHGNRQENFWTDIPEGSDMLPGALPQVLPGGLPIQQLDDLRQAVQQDEYGTGIDPHTPKGRPAQPGDAPEEQPGIQAQGDGSGITGRASDGKDASQAENTGGRLSGNYGRTAAEAEDAGTQGEISGR